MTYGVQLFGGMNLFNQNPQAVMAALKDMGYDVIEPCLSLDGEVLPFMWSMEKLPEYVAMARALGLSFDSCHVFAPDFSACVPQMVKAAEIAGFRRFVLGFAGPFTEEGVAAFVARCTETAGELKKHGLELWLHNVGPETAAQVNGMSAYEVVLHCCGGCLGAQVDTGWLVAGGVAPETFFARSGEYVRSIHHKDIAVVPASFDETINVPVGQGIVPPGMAYRFAKERSLPQLVDQDSSAGDLMKDLAEAVAFLKKMD